LLQYSIKQICQSVSFDAELFAVFDDAVASEVSPFRLEITMGNVIDNQDVSVALVVVTVAAMVVVVREEGSTVMKK
jgi:hypothetical protein